MGQYQFMKYISGWIALILFGLAGFCIFYFFDNLAVVAFVLVFFLSGFKVVQPNTALVATLFGKYAGVLMEPGFFYTNPLYSIKSISLKTDNYITETLKVNDSSGTPIEIAASIVYHIENPAAAVLDVEDPVLFLKVQSEGALRAIASHHPYSSRNKNEGLSEHSEAIFENLKEMIQKQVEKAGISIDEARFTHLSYAPEIAQMMLKKQQAEAIMMARRTLVRGAISMVEGTIKELESRKIVNLTETEKARLISNMMTVLLSDENASPVVKIG